MKKENRGDGEEPRKVGRLPEEPGTSSGDAGRKVQEDWSSSGTEDPAFLIKPSDGE